MTMSSTIQEVVLEFLSDKQEHSVQDIKHYLREQDVRDYTEGQFAGSLNTLMRNGSIKKVDRGIYSIKLRSEDMKKCFVVSPIAYSVRTAHPFRRNGAPFRFKLSKAQQVD